MAGSKKLYPRTGGIQTIYLKNAIASPDTVVGDYTMHNSSADDPIKFEQNNVLHHYSINHDRLLIGKFCFIVCGARSPLNSTNHTTDSLSTYPFPLFLEEWELEKKDIAKSQDNKGDIITENDVWTGYEAVILAGATVGNGATIGARAAVTKDVPPYTIVGGVSTRPIKKHFDNKIIPKSLDIQQWNWTDETIAQNIKVVQSGNMEQINRGI